MKEITDTLLSTKLFTEILRSLAFSSGESSSSLILRKKQPITHKTIKPTHNSMIDSCKRSSCHHEHANKWANSGSYTCR